MAIFTGMREGELAGLMWSDVDFTKRLITVQRSYDGPTKSDRVRFRLPVGPFNVLGYIDRVDCVDSWGWAVVAKNAWWITRRSSNGGGAHRRVEAQ
jgi:hypothetical protein